MEVKNKITVSVLLNANLETVWNKFTKPEHIIHWNFASDDWCSPKAENDLRVGGKFLSRMEAKDGSFGFDFEGTYLQVKQMELIEYILADERKVKILFEEKNNQVLLTETFDPENENPIEMQKGGWQAILNNFKKYVELN
ncbi:MAG: SRPBCC family protein [Bacteroidia bacterium]|nr:SRPBCC family protein [Bacteroidia bacterium]